MGTPHIVDQLQAHNAEVEASCRELIACGDMNLSSTQFVQDVGKMTVSLDDARMLRPAGFRIVDQESDGGFGYLSSSTDPDRAKEVECARFMADSFAKQIPPSRPLVVTVDDFIRFLPGVPSLVRKTLLFNEAVSKMFPDENFAIILTGFSDSVVFTDEVLRQIPKQYSAGLHFPDQSSVGRKVTEFAKSKILSLLKETKGDIEAIVKQIVVTTGAEVSDVKLLVATTLLIQDQQTWQYLWYEGKDKKTPLYIVGPKGFHAAISRLNFDWGHGQLDYDLRAWNSLGGNLVPLSENGDHNNLSFGDGLSAEEFALKVEPILDRLLN